MTVYVGSPYRCPGSVADKMAGPPDGDGIREGETVAWLTADTLAELHGFARILGVPSNRVLGDDHGLTRYVITVFERNKAMQLGAEVRMPPRRGGR